MGTRGTRSVRVAEDGYKGHEVGKRGTSGYKGYEVGTRGMR